MLSSAGKIISSPPYHAPLLHRAAAFAAVTVDIRPEGERTPKEAKTLTETVSPRGARVLMDREWRPGQRVLVAFLEEGIQSQTQIVYRQHLQGTKFAVRLELPSPLAL